MITNNIYKKVYKELNYRIFADFDNERVVDLDIVGLTQTNEVKNFIGDTVFLKEGDYIYLYMPTDETLPEYVFSEGYVIRNPYKFTPYKWCCKLTSKLEYIEDYKYRFSKLENSESDS